LTVALEARLRRDGDDLVRQAPRMPSRGTRASGGACRRAERAPPAAHAVARNARLRRDALEFAHGFEDSGTLHQIALPRLS
jgi:hypothetical protein